MSIIIEKVLFSEGMQASLNDINDMNNLFYNALATMLKEFIYNTNTTDLIFNTLVDKIVQEQSVPDMTVKVIPFKILQTRAGNGEWLVNNSNQNLAITSNSSGFSRYDIVEAKLIENDAELETRLLIDPISKQKYYGNIYTRKEYAIELKVVIGIPGGSPIPPLVDIGYVKLAEILVIDNASSISNSDIELDPSSWITETNISKYDFEPYIG